MHNSAEILLAGLLRVDNKGRHFMGFRVSQFQKYGNKTICRENKKMLVCVCVWIREIVEVLGSV